MRNIRLHILGGVTHSFIVQTFIGQMVVVHSHISVREITPKFMVKVDDMNEQTGNTSPASALVSERLYMRCNVLTGLWYMLDALVLLFSLGPWKLMILLQICSEPLIHAAEVATPHTHIYMYVYILSIFQLDTASLHSRHHYAVRQKPPNKYGNGNDSTVHAKGRSSILGSS